MSQNTDSYAIRSIEIEIKGITRRMQYRNNLDALKQAIMSNGAEEGFTLVVNDKEILNNEDLMKIYLSATRIIKGKLVYPSAFNIDQNELRNRIENILTPRSEQISDELIFNLQSTSNKMREKFNEIAKKNRF